MWQLGHKEGWAPKNWCFWTVVLEKTLESPLDCKEVKPVNPKGNQSWIFIGRTDAEAPILWPADAKNSFWKRFWCWERLKAGEGDDRGWDGWMASLTGWIWVWVEQAQGVEDGQGRPACYRVGQGWATEQLNWTEDTQSATYQTQSSLSVQNTKIISNYDNVLNAWNTSSFANDCVK